MLAADDIAGTDHPAGGAAEGASPKFQPQEAIEVDRPGQHETLDRRPGKAEPDIIRRRPRPGMTPA